jgi:acetolactate synthase-1/3 small subunit
MIVKIRIRKGELSEAMEAVNTFRASIVDLSPDSISIEVTGETSKLNAFLEYMRQYDIIEMCRTGPTAMGRGNYCLENE